MAVQFVPPMLTFYNGAKTLEEQVDHVIGKVLLQFQLEYEKFVPWRGISEPGVPQNEVENRCGEKQETDTLIKIDKQAFVWYTLYSGTADRG